MVSVTIYRCRKAVGGYYVSGRIIGVISLVLLTYMRGELGRYIISLK